MSRRYDLDPEAILRVGHAESGLNPLAVGDQGSSYGIFQLHRGGALPAGRGADWASSAAGIDYALRQMSKVAGGLKGRAAVEAIVRGFERPANPGGEIERAMAAQLGLAPTGVGAVPARPGKARRVAAQGPDLGQLRRQVALSQLQQMASGRPVDFMGMAQQYHEANVTAAQVRPMPRVQVEGQMTKGAQAAAAKAIKLAARFLGTPYVWGGANPKTGFDCSGLLQWVWAQQGVKIPRVTYDQFRTGKKVALRGLRPGDAVFFHGGPNGPGHVGMYIGHGKFIHSPHTGDVVKISSLKDYEGSFVGARRYA